MYRKDLEKTLGSLGLRQIFETYALPPRLLAYFASQCAKDAMSKLKDKGIALEPRAIAAISMAEDYGNGKDFSPEHMHKTVDDAYNAYYAASAADYAAYAATNAAHAAAYHAATYAAYATTNAAHAAAYHTAARSAYYADYYKPLFFSLIESRLSKLEKILIFG